MMPALIRGLTRCMRPAARVNRALTLAGVMNDLRARRSRGLRPPVVAIVGAREGAQQWRHFVTRGLATVVGFEPDADECRRLNETQSAATYLPYALGDRTGTAKLYVTVEPGCASCLEPNPEVVDRYPSRHLFAVNRVVDVPLHRYDELRAAGAVPQPDFVQIDVQGFEFEVLEGFGAALDKVLAVQLESHLVPVYKGQKLLSDLRPYLDQRGFMLRHLQPQGLFGGEAIELNASFVRRSVADPDDAALIRAWEQLYDVPPADVVT